MLQKNASKLKKMQRMEERRPASCVLLSKLSKDGDMIRAVASSENVERGKGRQGSHLGESEEQYSKDRE